LRADDSLGQAVEMGRPEGYIRPFVEEAAQVLPLLRVMAASRPDPYLTQLIVHAERVVPPAASNGGGAVLEPLTARERQVLGYLSSHLSGPEIAARIYVSPNTVKSHMKAIYRKIGAGSRAEAVATAVSLGLL
jgi:LuxR family transcriptional regulator, maltose regulon positive regulatory protein